MSLFKHLTACCALLFFTAVSSFAEDVDYVKDVLPILESYCIGCHTEDDPQGGLVMTDFAALMRGGSSGLSVTAGVPDSSRLLLMASGKLEPVMPPDGAEGPNESELEILARWIEQGANGPTGSLPIKKKLRTPKIVPTSEAPLPLTAIAQSHDGMLRADASFGEIELRSRAGKAIRVADEEPGKVNAIAFSPDDRSLAAAGGLTGAYGRVTLYDASSGLLLQEFLSKGDAFYAVAFHPNKPLLAAAGYDRVIRIWDTSDGEQVAKLKGHNGPIFDLAFSPSGNVLASACADETVKLWSIPSGQRLDTLGQPEGEVNAVDFSKDGKFVIAASADNRIRVWSLQSVDAPAINPLIATRYVDEAPIVDFDLSSDGNYLVTLSSAGNLKVLRTSDWKPSATLPPLPEAATDLIVDHGNQSIHVALMNGQCVSRDLPRETADHTTQSAVAVTPRWMDLDSSTTTSESSLKSISHAQDGTHLGTPVARNVVITGSIDQSGQVDQYRWTAKQGEVWSIDVDAASGSSIDPFLSILDATGRPVVRTRLQAIRDSYFTFRGKNSEQVNDFRIFNWQEMKLGEYL
ncbi:MAG: c-type cytochrome domain-containing protein, partial [Planctomycetota bacterium]